MQEKKTKAGWKTVVLYILGVIFAATFVYGVVYSVMNVMSTVSQYTAMGQDIPTSYTVNAIVSGILQLALPSLFFCAGSFALGSLLKGKGVKDDDDADAVEKIEVTETVEVKDDTAEDADKAETETDDAAEAATADDAAETAADAEDADEDEENPYEAATEAEASEDADVADKAEDTADKAAE